jgi:peptidoglycan/xylan/chitin deacetylase (PgdA/CDA1 family)
MTGGLSRMMIGGFGAVATPALLAAQRRRGAGVVLLYHRVSDARDPSYDPLRPQVFRRHCEILKARYQVLPLADLVSRVRAGESLVGCCAITFDDGYRDFLEHAYPVLCDLDLPATHFLVSDSVRTGKPNWNLRLKHVCVRRAPDLATAARNEARLIAELGPQSAAVRYTWLDAAEAEVGVEHPAMLSAEDLKRVSPELVEWASHTASHATLAACDDLTAREELTRSRDDIVAMSGRPVRFLSYPNGSYSAHTATLARACGYEAAFAVEQRETPAAGADVFALPRFDVGTLPPNMLVAETTGAVESLRRLRGHTSGGGGA